MKQKGYVCDYIEERDADLLRAYKEIISVRDNIRFSEVVAQLAKSPSKRFWVSELQAYKVVLKILGGDSLSGMIPTRKVMYQEIFRRYQSYSAQDGGSEPCLQRACTKFLPYTKVHHHNSFKGEKGGEA